MKRSHKRIQVTQSLYKRPSSVSSNNLMDIQNKFVNIKY